MDAQGFPKYEQTVVPIAMLGRAFPSGPLVKLQRPVTPSLIDAGHFPEKKSGLCFQPNGAAGELGVKHFAYRSAYQQDNKPHTQKQNRCRFRRHNGSDQLTTCYRPGGKSGAI
jgi:hypothetical protein